MKLNKTVYDLDFSNDIDCNKAIDIYPLNLCKTNTDFKSRVDVYKKLLPLDPYILLYAPADIKNNEELAMIALNEPWTFRYLSKSLKSLDTIIAKAYQNGRKQFLDFEMNNMKIDQDREVCTSVFQKTILQRCIDNQLYDGTSQKNEELVKD